MDRHDVSKNSDLEVLRAVAIMFTLLAHLAWGILPKLGPFGAGVHDSFQLWTGVDLFFAISGFIITTSLLRSRATANSGPKDGFFDWAGPFWIRRVFRLLPSAWLWIAITLLLTLTFNRHGSFGTLRNNLGEATAAGLNFTNLYYYDWFASNHPTYGSFGVYWSLSLEEQFYLVFPFLLFFVPRRRLILLLVAGFLVQFFLNRPSGFVPGRASLLWFVRTDALILGVLIALWKEGTSHRPWQPTFLRHRAVAPVTAALCVFLLAALPASAGTAQMATGLVAVVSGILVLLASFDQDLILPQGRLKSALVWLGSRSYSIYLVHTTGRTAVVEFKRTAGIAAGSAGAVLWTAISLALILLLSEFNYRLVETPFRRIGRRLADGRGPRNEAVGLATNRAY